MSYCSPVWTSDYTYVNILNWRSNSPIGIIVNGVRSPEEAKKLREEAQKELSPGIQKQLEKEIRPAIAPIPPKTLSPTPKPEEKKP